MFVVDANVLIDGVNQLGHTVEHPAPDSLLSQLTRHPFHQVQPRGARWREVHFESGMLASYFFTSACL